MADDGESPSLSVVVPTRNRAQRLTRLLGSLARQTLDRRRFEVVVVDDGSTDDTAELLAAPPVSEIRIRALRTDGRGPAAARNAGWRTTGTPLIVFTDDDCEATPGWLEEIYLASKAHPEAIIQGPTAPIPRELGLTGPFTRTKDITEPSPWYQTCNIAYPRGLLERLGGFDERFPEAQGEDADLGWRARELGAQPVWREAALVHHAVDDLGPIGFLRDAARSAGAVRIFRRHPELRESALRWGVVRNPRLPWLALTVAGMALGRRHLPWTLLSVLPYARHLLAVCRMQRAPLALLPYYAAWDLVFVLSALRSSLHSRSIVL